MIQMGAININEIILTDPEKRHEDDVVSLSYYLTDRIAFFRNEDFLNKEFMISVAHNIKYEVFN